MYAAFTYKILNYVLGDEHSIAVSEYVDTNSGEKDKVFVFIVPGNRWFPRVIGKNGQTINLIENLLKLKGYLQNCWVTVRVEK